RHCRSVGGDVVELGCRFQTPPGQGPGVNPLEEVREAVAGLIQRLQVSPPPGEERRVHPRVAYTEQGGILSRTGAAPATGFARGPSKGGIAFITTAPLPAEEMILSLPQGEGSALRVRAKVVRCAKVTEGFYDVGARFLGLEPGP